MRLVPIPPAKLNDAQRQLFDSIVAFTRAQNPKFAIADEQGALVGPFNPMVHFPQFGNAAWGVNLALSKNTTLPKPVHELTILVTGARSLLVMKFTHMSWSQAMRAFQKPRSPAWLRVAAPVI